MRAFLGLLLTFGALAPVAQAVPVTVREALGQLRDRGATQLEGVVLSGTPVLKGALGEQGFDAAMYQCDRPAFACRVIVFRSCNAAVDISYGDAVALANTYNTRPEPRGYMLVSGSASAPSLCVQARYDLNSGNAFDQGETFNWQQTVRSFLEFLDADTRSRLARSVLD